MRLAPLAFIACVIAAGAAQAGTVSVSFSDPNRFSDVGVNRWEQDANVKTLASYIESLGPRYLPANQSLKIDLVDVDLAGEVRPTRRRPDLRIARGQADWPKVTVRYTLESNGHVLRQGEETISDLDYQHHANPQPSDPLYAEKRMLDQWFRERFAAGAQ
jgi:hypothetical protein